MVSKWKGASLDLPEKIQNRVKNLISKFEDSRNILKQLQRELWYKCLLPSTREFIQKSKTGLQALILKEFVRTSDGKNSVNILFLVDFFQKLKSCLHRGII